MRDRIFDLETGDSPLVALALHDGHAVRGEVARLLAVTDEERLREEDPFTAEWVGLAPIRVVGTRSRFEVDLNRPAERAIYRSSEEAWGLEVWRQDLPTAVSDRSLAQRAVFYEAMEKLFTDLAERYSAFVLFDLHTYNHRRGGPGQPAAPVAENPQIDVGTFLGHRDRWASLIERFAADLRNFDFPGGSLDVRENVRFPIGPFAKWAHERFPGRVCALSIEVKKFFMDEWTGVADRELLCAVGEALASTVPGVLEELERFEVVRPVDDEVALALRSREPPMLHGLPAATRL